MDFQALIQHYGYGIVLVGTFLEGETVLIIAAALARLGYLQFPIVLGVAAAGAFVGDNFYFFLGRRFGPRALARFSPLARAVPRVDALLARWRWGAVILLRFMYGLRTVGPIVIGAGSMPAWEFVAANAAGALFWAALIGAIGFATGHAAEQLLGDVQEVEKLLLGVGLLIASAVLVTRTLRRRQRERRGKSDAA